MKIALFNLDNERVGAADVPNDTRAVEFGGRLYVIGDSEAVLDDGVIGRSFDVRGPRGLTARRAIVMTATASGP